jgi:hypothetical protein
MHGVEDVLLDRDLSAPEDEQVEELRRMLRLEGSGEETGGLPGPQASIGGGSNQGAWEPLR